MHPLLSLFGIPHKKHHRAHPKHKPLLSRHLDQLFKDSKMENKIKPKSEVLKPKSEVLKEESEIKEMTDMQDMKDHKEMPNHGDMASHLEMPDHEDNEDKSDGWYDYDGHYNSVKKRSVSPMFKPFDPFKTFNSPFHVITEDDDDTREVRNTRDIPEFDEDKDGEMTHSPFNIFGGLMDSLNKLIRRF